MHLLVNVINTMTLKNVLIIMNFALWNTVLIKKITIGNMKSFTQVLMYIVIH